MKFEVLDVGTECQVCVEIQSTASTYPIFFSFRHGDHAAAVSEVKERLMHLHIDTTRLFQSRDE